MFNLLKSLFKDEVKKPLPSVDMAQFNRDCARIKAEFEALENARNIRIAIDQINEELGR